MLTLSLSLCFGEDRDRFGEAVDLFSSVFVTALNGFEKCKVETDLRGFSLRGDSFPGFRASEYIPSPYGVFLRVNVADEGPDNPLFDTRHAEDGYILRKVRIPQLSTNDQSLEISFSYGAMASKSVVSAINVRIDRIVKRYR